MSNDEQAPELNLTPLIKDSLDPYVAEELGKLEEQLRNALARAKREFEARNRIRTELEDLQRAGREQLDQTQEIRDKAEGFDRILEECLKHARATLTGLVPPGDFEDLIRWTREAAAGLEEAAGGTPAADAMWKKRQRVADGLASLLYGNKVAGIEPPEEETDVPRWVGAAIGKIVELEGRVIHGRSELEDWRKAAAQTESSLRATVELLSAELEGWKKAGEYGIETIEGPGGERRVTAWGELQEAHRREKERAEELAGELRSSHEALTKAGAALAGRDSPPIGVANELPLGGLSRIRPGNPETLVLMLEDRLNQSNAGKETLLLELRGLRTAYRALADRTGNS